MKICKCEESKKGLKVGIGRYYNTNVISPYFTVVDTPPACTHVLNVKHVAQGGELRPIMLRT